MSQKCCHFSTFNILFLSAIAFVFGDKDVTDWDTTTRLYKNEISGNSANKQGFTMQFCEV